MFVLSGSFFNIPPVALPRRLRPIHHVTKKHKLPRGVMSRKRSLSRDNHAAVCGACDKYVIKVKELPFARRVVVTTDSRVSKKRRCKERQVDGYVHCPCITCMARKCTHCSRLMDIFGKDRRSKYYPYPVSGDVCSVCVRKFCIRCKGSNTKHAAAQSLKCAECVSWDLAILKTTRLAHVLPVDLLRLVCQYT